MFIKLLEILKTYWKQLVFVTLGAFIAFKAQGCYHKIFPVKNPQQVTLPPNMKEIITVQPNKVTVITQKGTTEVTGSRKTIITEDKSGNIKITETTYGFEHQIGMDTYLSSHIGVGLDLRYFYYKNFDAMAGIGYLPTEKKADLWLGLSYTPHTSWTNNTSLFIGYSPMAQAPVAGISLHF